MILDIDKNSPADLAGVKPGDKILFIDSVNVEKSTCEDIKNKLYQAISSSCNDELTLVVMNAIEYNISKSNETLLTRNEQDNGKNPLKNNSKNTIRDSNIVQSLSETEFNPFDDIPNELVTPFLHYSSIPPPETFQLNGEDKMRNDSLEESTTETISSSIDITQKKESNQNNLNDFDFISNLTSTTDFNTDANSYPSNLIFQESSQFKMPWSIESYQLGNTENMTIDFSNQDKKEF